MVNIVIPTYKAKNTLPKLLDSLVAQTTPMFFVTIVQDFDGEDYDDIITEYRQRGLKIKLLQLSKNGGPGVARQAGIKYTYDSGIEFVMFADSDDMLLPYAVEILSKEIKKSNCDIICSSFYREEYPGFVHLLDVKTTPITWCHGKIYKVSYLIENNIYFLPDMRCSEDSYFNAVAFNLTENKSFIETPTYYWRDNKDSLTHQQDWMERDIIQFIQGQVVALNRILQSKEKLSYTYISKMLINIYTYMMQQILYGLVINDYVDHLMTLKEIPQVQEVINSKEFYKFLSDNLKATIYNEKSQKYEIAPVSFETWLNYYIRKEENNNE